MSEVVEGGDREGDSKAFCTRRCYRGCAGLVRRRLNTQCAAVSTVDGPIKVPVQVWRRLTVATSLAVSAAASVVLDRHRKAQLFRIIFRPLRSVGNNRFGQALTAEP
jgi:hypothetical protein